MKKVLKIIIIIFIVLCLFACVCGIVDKTRIINNKEPIFAINRSGGSAILYIGPGYVIDGAWDDDPGGIENTKIHTWLWFIYENK